MGAFLSRKSRQKQFHVYPLEHAHFSLKSKRNSYIVLSFGEVCMGMVWLILTGMEYYALVGAGGVKVGSP